MKYHFDFLLGMEDLSYFLSTLLLSYYFKMSSRSSSSSSTFSSLGDWDQPGNVIDTLGLEPPPRPTELEKKLKSKYSFDKEKEFSDVRIFSMQSSKRVGNLFDLLKFPCQPFFSSIFCVFNTESLRFKPERFLQRRVCLKSCNWNPTKCFLEDSHSGNLEDLMTQDFHSFYNPKFDSYFNKEKKNPQVVYTSRFYPPNLNPLLEELGISTILRYANGNALNFDYLSDEKRKAGSPLFTFEEKKCHDIIDALIEATKEAAEEQKEIMKKIYEESYSFFGKLTKPILSLMMWGPQSSLKFQESSNRCDLKFDPDDKNIHECSNFAAKHFWMFSHGDGLDCDEGLIKQMDGPVVSDELTVIYPCNKGRCNMNCICQLCEQTRTKICPSKNHRKHLTKFDKDCPVQEASQCQEHWVGHPDNFNRDEDILVEKNLFFHNNTVVDQPRSYKNDILKFAGIKKSCQTCRTNLQDHFENHMIFHLQCKLCLFQMATMEDPNFWSKVCNICSKIIASDNSRQMYWHKRVHKETGEFKCPLCDLVLKRKYFLKRHMKDIHDQEHSNSTMDRMSSEDSDTDESETNNDWYQCDQCDTKFRLRKYLEKHIRFKHGTNNYPCEACGTNFRYPHHLKRHKITIHDENDGKYIFAGENIVKIFSCEICSKEFKRKDHLNKHLPTHSKSKDNFFCEFCEETFSRKDTLKEHIKVYHENPDICYTCQQCGKKFKKNSNLKRHMAGVHHM